MGSTLNTYGSGKVPSTTYYVDANTPYPLLSQNGSNSLPYATVQQAVDDGYNKSLAEMTINVAIGNYQANSITLHQDTNYVIQGDVSGFALLGPITWTMNGHTLPITQSGLVLRQVAPLSISILDGYPLSSNSLLIMENCFCFGDIIQSGTGSFAALISGISTASSSISGLTVSSAVLGSINIPSGNLGLTNTQVSKNITATKLWCSESQFTGDGYSISLSGTASTMDQILFLSAPTIIFTGSPGILYVDSATNYHLVTGTYTLTNGSKIVQGSGIIQTITAEITSDTSTTSGTWVDLLSVTFTTVNHSKLLLAFTANFSVGIANRGVEFRFLIDGSAGRAGVGFASTSLAGDGMSVNIQQPLTTLAAGSHTVKVQWQNVTAGVTAQIRPVTAPNSESACLFVLESLV